MQQLFSMQRAPIGEGERDNKRNDRRRMKGIEDMMEKKTRRTLLHLP
jgi:hypothetical protein